MNLSIKGISTNKDTKLNTSKNIIALNPNAVEFVPFARRSASKSCNATTATGLDVSRTSGKAILDWSEFSGSNISDDEAYQYWQRQLPDDITPDFKFMGEELQGSGNLSVAGLSIRDGIETSRYPTSACSLNLLGKQKVISSHDSDHSSLSEKMRYSLPTYGEDPSSASFMNLPTNPWDRQFMNDNLHLTSGKEGHPSDGDSGADLPNDLSSEHVSLDDTGINPLEYLASQFPGFAVESLEEVYYANGCDLNFTIEMLTQLELQVDGGFNQNLNSKTQSALNPSALDFPTLPLTDAQNGLPKYAGEDLQQTSNQFHSLDKDNLLFKTNSSGTTRAGMDFASAVWKLPSQDSSQWKYKRNGSSNFNAGTGKSSQLLASFYNGHGRYGERVQTYGTAGATHVWPETGEAAANLYSELREEALEHAQLQNAYFEQARQAYLIGNNALGKELSVKGQLHNMQMRTAHERASESIYQQRNRNMSEFQSRSRAQEQLIDLHGLHVSEAINLLKHELRVVRSVASSAAQRLQVLICVGTGHHTRGSRTPARLPVAIERYLLEEEGLEYTEAQPGLLRVVIR